MSRKSHIKRFKYPIIGAVLALAAMFFYLRHHADGNTLASSEKHQTGYKAAGYKEEDRRKLEMLIHQGGKDD